MATQKTCLIFANNATEAHNNLKNNVIKALIETIKKSGKCPYETNIKVTNVCGTCTILSVALGLNDCEDITVRLFIEENEKAIDIANFDVETIIKVYKVIIHYNHLIEIKDRISDLSYVEKTFLAEKCGSLEKIYDMDYDEIVECLGGNLAHTIDDINNEPFGLTQQRLYEHIVYGKSNKY